MPRPACLAVVIGLGALVSACTEEAPPAAPLLDGGPRQDVGGGSTLTADGGGMRADGAAPGEDGANAPRGDAATDGSGDAASADVGGRDAPDCDGRADCDGDGSCETELGTSQSCLSCDDRCESGPGSSSSCEPGRGCRSRCDEGFADCDGLESNGCEVLTRGDPMHCGDCTTICAESMPGARASCEAGACTFVCTSGRSDCDGDLSDGGGNGCETDVTSSLDRCGSCETPCTLPASAAHAEAACRGGLCEAQCSFGFADCDGDPLDGCENVGPTCS